jgi:Tfp pilus assembly protein PilZ
VTVALTPASPICVPLKCPDADDFVGRFAPNVTRGGLFIPTRETREVGASIRFELALQDGTVVFAGEGVVTWAKPKGLGVKFTTLDPDSAPMLERLLREREAGPAAEPDKPATPLAAAPVAAAPITVAPVVAAPRVAAPAAAPPPARPAIASPPPIRPAIVSPAPARPAAPPPAPARPAAPPPASPVAIEVRPTPPLGTPPPIEFRPTPPLGTPARVETRASAIAWTSISNAAAWMASAKRALVRRPALLAAAAVCIVVVAVVSVSVGRARLDTRPSVEAAKTAAVAPAPGAASAVQPTAPPALANAMPSSPPVVAPRQTTPAAEPSSTAPRGGLHVDSLLVAASYKHSACPNPTSRLSVRSSKTVNVCLHATHRQGRVDHLTLVWERDGAFAGKTQVKLPASRSTVRTRAHLKISAHRLGAWSVRVVSGRDAPLAQATFDVVR